MLYSYHIYDGGHIQVHKRLDSRDPWQQGSFASLFVGLVQTEKLKKSIISFNISYIIAVFRIISRCPTCEDFLL